MCFKLKYLFAVLLVGVLAATAQSNRVVRLSGADRFAGRRLYAEDRRKSLCVDAPFERRHYPSIHRRQHTTNSTNDTLINTTVQLWHNGVVPYVLSHQFSARYRARIAEAIDFFKADSCVHWASRTTEPDYVLFTPRGMGCTTDVGRRGGRQTIVLGDVECIREVGDVLQLMLHALGLYHEHQRVDRDEWISVHFDNIPPRLHWQFWKVNTNITALEGTRYDFASLTHFGMSDRNKHPVLRPKVDGFQLVLGQRRHFSHGDIDKLHRLYPCNHNGTRSPVLAKETTRTSPITTAKPPTTTTTEAEKVVNTSHRCILLIGGKNLGRTPLIEYYHPTADECDASVIGKMSTDKVNETDQTSGCYLPETDQIVIREGGRPNKPPMLYGLPNQLAKKLPYPYKGSNGSPSATCCGSAVAISTAQCLSCGMYRYRSEDGFLSQCYQFNTSSDRWTPIPPMPMSVAGTAAVSLNPDSFYIIGGYDGTAVDKMYRYSISERRWHREPPMSRGRHAHAAAVISATEFIVCGGDAARSDCEVFNTIKRSWRRVGNLNTGRESFAMLRFNGRVYALGGTTYSPIKSVEVYDPATESWTSVKPLEHKRMMFVAVVV